MTQVMTRHGEIVVDIKLQKKLGDLTDEEHEIYRGLILHIMSYMDEKFSRENYGIFIPDKNEVMYFPKEETPERIELDRQIHEFLEKRNWLKNYTLKDNDAG